MRQRVVFEGGQTFANGDAIPEGCREGLASSSIPVAPPIGLEQYYSEAGPDYAAWSREFNMHFGYYRLPGNPLQREAMLEQMNAEVLARLRLGRKTQPHLLDLGCGLGATLRSFARRLPDSELTGITRVPWQVEQGYALNEAAGLGERIHIVEADYEHCPLASSSFDGVYALESSCYGHGADKHVLLQEAHRLLRSGGRLAVADGFIRGPFLYRLQQRIYRKLCECWVVEEFAQLDRFTQSLASLGFTEIMVEHLQMRVAPSVMHVPWVTMRFLLSEVVLGENTMTRARWNNLLAPLILPLVSVPLGPLSYCMITATKA